jgi:hypothetical protein
LAYLRKFEGLIDIILDDAELFLSDGETVSISTRSSLRRRMEKEDDLIKFGRRIDIIVQCSCLGVTFVASNSRNKMPPNQQFYTNRARTLE